MARLYGYRTMTHLHRRERNEMENEEKQEPTFEEELEVLCNKYNVTIVAIPKLVPSHGGAFVIDTDLRIIKK